MAGFDNINQAYGLALEVGSRCIYDAGRRARHGTVIGTKGTYVRVRFDDAPGKPPSTLHPTWKMRYSPPLSTTGRGSDE